MIDEGREPLLTKKPKGLSAIEGRGLVLVTVSLSFAILLTSVPTIFHFWDPTPDYESQEITCQKTEDIPIEEAMASPCKSALLKDPVQPGSTTIKNVSVLKCSFNETEKDIREVLNLIRQVLDHKSKEAFKIQKCLNDVVPLICNILYRNCDNPGLLPTAETCLTIKDEVCGTSYWNLAASILTTATKRGRCLAIPDCERDFPSQNNSSPGNESRPGNHTVVWDIALGNPSDVSSDCKKPLVPTTLSNPMFPIKCSPACLEKSWATESVTVALDIVLHFTVFFNWMCCIFTFITWAFVSKLRRFPTITSLFLAISYAIANLGLSLPIFIGRHRAYCSHEDVFSVMIDPSTVCKIQGVLVHFGLLSATAWWLCYIFNMFILVHSKTPRHIIVDHPRILFFTEFLVSVVIPSTVVVLVMAIGGAYTTFSVQVVLCLPATANITYFTASLPLQLIVLCGFILMAMVIIRLRKVRAFRVGYKIDSSLLKTVEKRFILIIIFFPLCLGFIFTTIAIYGKLVKKIMINYLTYASCLLQNSEEENQRACLANYRKYGTVQMCIVDLVVLAIFGFVLMISTILVQPARQFWCRILRKCFRCKLNSKTSVERNVDVKKRKCIRPDGSDATGKFQILDTQPRPDQNNLENEGDW